jgi:hypothetical protein
MSNKKDDVLGKMPAAGPPGLPDLPDMPSPEEIMKTVMRGASEVMGGPMEALQELAAWQTFAAMALAGLGILDDPEDVRRAAWRAGALADALLVIWRERRVALMGGDEKKRVAP